MHILTTIETYYLWLMIYSCIGIVGLILGDLLMVLVDPRISLHGKGDAR